MYAGVVLGVLFLFNGPAREQIEGILAGATLIAAVGILDDRGLLHHQVKLFVGMPLAAGILLLSGIRAQVFNAIFGGRTGDLLDIVLTVVWVVGITASFSILDHMDGLCAGVAAMASAFFGGAMFLGFLMATLGLKLRLTESNVLSAWVVAVLVLGATIFDTALVTISRSRRGLLPFATPGKDHAAHRLANLGLGQRGAVLAMYILGAASGSLALLFSFLPLAMSLGLIAFAVVAALSGIAFLERAPYERQTANPAAAGTD